MGLGWLRIYRKFHPGQRCVPAPAASSVSLRYGLAEMHYHGNIWPWQSHNQKSQRKDRYRCQPRCAGNSGSVLVPSWNGMSEETRFWSVDRAGSLPRTFIDPCFPGNRRQAAALLICRKECAGT